MPIRPDLRHYYRDGWLELRESILARCGHKCEWCGVEEHAIVLRHRAKWASSGDLKLCGTSITLGWRSADFDGERSLDVPARETRWVYIALGIAHLDHNPANRSEENLKALCGHCHLKYDLQQHKSTRSSRKDQQRPLLALCS